MQNYICKSVIPFGAQVAGTTANCGTIAIGTTLLFLCDIPSDDLGGGITITGMKGFANAAIAAASAPQISLVTLSSAYALNGTAWQLGSVAYGAGTPKAGTAGTQWLDQDDGHYYLALQVEQIAALAVGTLTLDVSVGYQQGR